MYRKFSKCQTNIVISGGEDSYILGVKVYYSRLNTHLSKYLLKKK